MQFLIFRRLLVLTVGFILMGANTLQAQQAAPFTPEELRTLVETFKQDPRGPYQGIRWFCPDGSIIGAQERCSKPGGRQHALLKDRVVQVQQRNRIYLGQILAGTPHADFLDATQRFSRAAQYQMEQFLQAADDGWIMRRARYYRGAVQAEDEEAWGQAFLAATLADDALVHAHFFFLRQLTRDLPHLASDNVVQQVRADAKTIADAYPAFMDLRVKIHGQPDASDLEAVRTFQATHRTRTSASVQQQLAALQAGLERLYAVSNAERLGRPIAHLPATLPLKPRLNAFATQAETSTAATIREAADLLWAVRLDMGQAHTRSARLALMDVSLALEDFIFRTHTSWQPATTGELLDKAYTLAQAAAGSGWMEIWEWEALTAALHLPPPDASLSLPAFRTQVEQIRRAVEWGVGLADAVYEPTVSRFDAFEPLSHGFLDDRLRSSVLLPLGELVGQLSGILALHAGQTNTILDLRDPSQIRGLNPGYAVGTLQVISGPAEDVAFTTDKIYILGRAPAEMKPVAGIATVSEGNVVSHVQLLARNLGIPNAVLTPEALRALQPYDGEQIFYAVSPRGTVRMKLASAMNAEERALVATQQRSETRIRVPTDRLVLDNNTMTALYDLRSADSGRLCGPKAANLGQLSALFPGRVAPGFIIPFGIFHAHMRQPMPDTDGSYWDYLKAAFAEAETARSQRTSEAAVETALLERLATLRTAIEAMPLQPAFVEAFRERFPDVFGTPLGQTPVFVRSDTNMEDLKDFTGAGLNLTVPNVVSEADLLQAIRRVWASPYRERGYRWRQKYLLNPEDVYPSLLVLQSVNVDKSGVMITTGLASAEPLDGTVAFNWGVGGAVDGQAAETYLLRHTGEDELLAPAREPTYRTLPPTGGVATREATFNIPMLTAEERSYLRDLATDIRRRLPQMPGIESAGPFDVELGFLEGTPWLFQVRPFVENRNARSTNYLLAMDPAQHPDTRVRMDTPLSD